MDQKFKTARMLHMAFIAALLIYAFVFSMTEKEHYASSEAKMNFLRLVVIIVSAVQVMLGAAMKKILSSAKSADRPQQLLTAGLFGAALCESGAIFGLILAFISGRFWDYGICAGIALLGLLWTFPRKAQWQTVSGNETLIR